MIVLFADDWKFQFCSSIEHFYPQHPADGNIWDSSELNCFGNLALITVSGNSTLSNLSPSEKIVKNQKIIQQSLKLKTMLEMMDRSGEEKKWTLTLAKENEKKMFEILDGNGKFNG